MSKLDSYFKTFIENQLPVKSNQIHEFVTVCSIKYLPLKIGGKISLLSFAVLQSWDKIVVEFFVFKHCFSSPQLKRN